MKKIFVKNGKICVVEKDTDEAIEIFNERGYFIVSQKINNEDDFNKAILFSRIFINVKYNKCKYSDEIMSELSSLI